MKELRKILHVEDDLDIQEIAKIALEVIGGFEVTQFASGADAIENAKQIDPDLFLLDVMMPGLSGEQTLEALRKIEGLESKPAIFMTAKAQEADVTALRDFGAVEVITKPFDPMELANQIQMVWQKAQ
ncbi:response regulator [Actibacterium sp. D379-3]